MATTKKLKRYTNCPAEYNQDVENPCVSGRQQKPHYHCHICKTFTAFKPKNITTHIELIHGETHALPTSSMTAKREQINVSQKVTEDGGSRTFEEAISTASQPGESNNNEIEEDSN
ncbi:uncharacterized protein LOC113670451, partial [Pocillopora damicornis]|uniref:uncharacterized protein LOC113670451 n=1 Tax=Pocillopora damicornis TaxID=46731 RepID=UPI000F552802